jgi:hypothetical protein
MLSLLHGRREAEGRDDAGAVAGVDAGLLDVLHDGTDDGVGQNEPLGGRFAFWSKWCRLVLAILSWQIVAASYDPLSDRQAIHSDSPRPACRFD